MARNMFGMCLANVVFLDRRIRLGALLGRRHRVRISWFGGRIRGWILDQEET